MMKIVLAIFVIIVCVPSGTGYCQSPPVFNHFFANPFQFNPSYAAENGYTEMNLFYRRQWLGIDNAPEAAAINIQAPVGRNVSLGFTAYSDKTILLTNTSVLATFGYRARFSHNHHLNFGISAGIGFNNFDLSDVEDLSDPALAGVLDENTYVNGQFGLNYRWKNFNIGYSFPKLFNSKPNSVESFNEVEFDKFDQRFASVSYNIPLRNIEISPIVLYRAIDEHQDQLEGMLITTFKNVLWIGASYREEYGITGFIGLNVKRLLRIGYSHERATGDISDAVGGTHEIYIGARLGKRNREDQFAAIQDKKDSLSLVSAAPAEPEEQVEPEEDVSKEAPPPPVERPFVEQVTADDTQIVAGTAVESRYNPAIEEDGKPETVVAEAIPEPPISTQMQKVELKAAVPQGYYLVVGVFKVPENALRVMKNLREDGRTSSIIYNHERNYYYVYLNKSLDKQEIIRQLQIIKRENRFFAAWVYTAY